MAANVTRAQLVEGLVGHCVVGRAELNEKNGSGYEKREPRQRQLQAP